MLLCNTTFIDQNLQALDTRLDTITHTQLCYFYFAIAELIVLYDPRAQSFTHK